ncbi:MAG: stress response serine/threonine protein kinase YihE [Lysobacterales bacterium 69-70]|nr:serine/threonine protein kinase [Xanthomonadaceae bacterium]ODU31637.1 MAG: stress response serine/threonine protein kinase YihE [Xanthomonadaceae bacterium SCN 69-320]ODV15348.1 MAG: stress response serine/threonine protein kinase YihE [Xanthomonadaceae bacterium SCN 69-25]OJY97823.1 MAG: stress response serine/threonine protein kinase YihE [Xanthomonadales bacterium 69-70]
MSAAAPYADLTPERVLAAVEALGLATDGRLLALNSYENRVYQVGIEDAAPVVAKFYRPGRWTDAAIAEEHAFAAELAAAELPVVAPLIVQQRSLHAFEGHRLALYPRRGGRAPELESAEHLQWMGRLIARIHGIGARTRFTARGAIDLATFLQAPAAAVLASPLLPAGLASRYRAAIAALETPLRQRLDAAGARSLRLHGDCHPGNVLWTDHGPHFVDLDDARMGPAVQDLWMLAPDERALELLLEGYQEFRDFDHAELGLIDTLRLLRQVHWAGWIAQRWHDPAFPLAFPFVAEPRWWEQHTADLADAALRLQE